MASSASTYTKEDMPGPSVVPVGHARANRRAVYEDYKSKFIGDLKFFITWIKNGAPVAVIGLRQAVTYAGQRYYTESITEDGTYNLSNGEVPSKLVILYENIPYEKLILPDSHFVRGSLSINDLQFYLDKLKLDVTNIQSIFLKLHSDQNALSSNFTMKSRTGYFGYKTKPSKGEVWLRDQAKQIFDKIKDFYSAKQNLRNRDAADTISDVDTILDKFVGVLQLIIPREIHTYYDMEKERERQAEIEERRRRVEGDTPRDHRRERSRSPVIDHNRSIRGHESPPRRSVRPERGHGSPVKPGGKSMKPKQHRNSKTQKKRQHKNQKK